MKLLFILVFLSICNNFFCDDLISNRNELENSILSNIDKNLLIINQKKYYIMNSDSILENSSLLLTLKTNGLEKVFLYDTKDIMIKEYSFKNYILNSTLLSKNYLMLKKIDINKIYLSDIFNQRNEVYYFLGIKSKDKYILFLFNTMISNHKYIKFVIFDGIGGLIFNNGYSENDIVKYSVIIKDQSCDEFSNFFEKHSFSIYSPSRRYFILKK